ncbi:unnamed protein product [Miscanthus lutarioriparius]|uniref:Uncharacterized protein n=1 Tax=Miscanthus lutarioriparius TaxID=422564 RepID=A0A811PUB2_9POAL|nr:unnamed protein product [Miscanthus lutarioriparius]
MATEDEAREAADGTEVQVEAVDLGTVHLQAHPEGKLSSLMEIKSMGETIDSTEGTLKIPEDQVFVEAPSDVQLPPEHNLNGEASSVNGHTDKEEKISNEQPHDNDQEEAELDQSNRINKEDVTDGLSHGESTTEDSCLLKHKKDEEPKGDDQQDLGVTVDDDSVQEDTLKTDNAIEQTDDGQQDQNQEPAKANENTEPASITNNADVDNAIEQIDDGQQDQNQEPEKANENTEPASIANNADVEIVTEAPTGLQAPVEKCMNDSDGIPETIDEKTETDEPAKADGVVHPEEVAKVEDQQSQQADTMDAEVALEEIKCEETDQQEERPKSEAHEPTIDAQGVLNQESAEEIDDPMNEKIEETVHQRKVAAPKETTLEPEATMSAPPVNTQVQNQESLEEIEDTEAEIHPSSGFGDAIPEDQSNLGVTIDNDTVNEDTMRAIEQQDDGQQDEDLELEKATEHTQSASMTNIPHAEIVTEAPSGVQTPGEPNLDNSDAVPDTIDGNTETDEPAKAHAVVHPDQKESFPEDTSTAEPTKEVVKAEDQHSQQADTMDANMVQEEEPKSEHADKPATDALEVLNQESAEEIDGPVNTEETAHQETTPEYDTTTREPPVDIHVQNQESLEEREATVEEREVAEAVDTEAPVQQSSVAFEEAVPEDQHNLGVTNNTVQEDTLEATGQTKDGRQYQDLGPENATDDTQPATTANIPDVEVITEAPSGIQITAEINLDISDSIPDTTDGNTETDELSKAQDFVHPDKKESFPEDTSTTEPTEEVVRLEDKQSQQADAMDADVVQEVVPKSEHTDEPATDALEVLNQESAEETDVPVNQKTEETAHQSNMPASEETRPQSDATTREPPVDIHVQNQESLEEREATVEEREVAEAVDTEAPVQQSSVAFEEAVPEDQHNLGVTNNTVQEDTLEATGQTKDGQQYQDLGPENATEDTQPATTANIPDVEVITEAPSGIQITAEINLDISDSIPDTTDGNTETDELSKAQDFVHPDKKESFPEDTSTTEPTEEVVRLEDQQLQEVVPKSEHTDEPATDALEVLNQESAEETDVPVNQKTEETAHQSNMPASEETRPQSDATTREPPVDIHVQNQESLEEREATVEEREVAEAVDTEAPVQQSSVAFEEAVPEDQHNLGVTNNTVQEDTLEATGQTKDGQQYQDLGPENATEDTQSATTANIPDVEVITEAPSGIQITAEINLDISDYIPDTTDGNTETDELSKAQDFVHPDKEESFPEDTSTTEPTEEVVRLEDQQSQQADAMDADVVQEVMPKSEHTDEPATDALEVLNQESAEETDVPVNQKTEETAHQSNMPVSEETTPEYDATREPPVTIQVQNQESLEEREATIEEREVAEAVDTEATVQQSSAVLEEAVPEDKHNLGATNNTVQEYTQEAIGQTKDGQQYQDLGPENATENTQPASMANIPDEVITEASSGVQTPVEINRDISDAIPDTTDGNTETDELVKADGAIHPDHKESFLEDTCIAEPTEEVIKVEEQLGQQADAIDADVLQEEAPKSEHADEPGVDAQEVLNQESTEETDGLVNVKTEETEHKSNMVVPEDTMPEHDAHMREPSVNIQEQSQESVGDAEAVDTEAEMQQSSVAFEETTPENHVATTEPCSEIQHAHPVEPEEINVPGDGKDDEITNMSNTENLVQDNILQSGPTIDTQPVQELEQNKTDEASNQNHAAVFNDLAQEDATATSEPQVIETEELKDIEATEAEEITKLDHVTPSKELAVENDSTADEPDNGEIHQTLERDLVEVKDTETYHEKTISTSEDTVEDNVAADEPSCGSQEVDNAESTEETKQNIAENTAEVSDVVIVDEAIEQNVLQTEDITETHKQELEPEETKSTEPVESEEASDQRNAAQFDYSAQEDNIQESEMRQTESATEIKEIETTEVEAVPRESNTCVSEEPSQEDHIKESETSCDNQEVNITESSEVIDGHKDIITGGISDQSNTASAGGSAEESNVPEGEPPADIQAVQDLGSEEINNTQIDEVNEKSLEMNATVFQMPTQEENPATTELHESTEVSNIEATEVHGNPHQSDAAPQSESTEPSSDTQADNSQLAEETEDTENVKSNTALAEAAAPETDATADTSSFHEADLEETKDTGTIETEDVMTSSDYTSEKILETMETEAVPHESNFADIKEHTEDDTSTPNAPHTGSEPVRELESVEDSTDTTEHPGETHGSTSDDHTPTEENTAVTEPSFNTQEVQNLTSQEIKDIEDDKTDEFSDISSFPTPGEADQVPRIEPTPDVQEVQELGLTEETRDIEAVEPEDQQEHIVSTLEKPAVDGEPNADAQQVHEDKLPEVEDNKAIEADEASKQSNIATLDNAAEERNELESDPDSYAQPAEQVELSKDNENSKLVKAEETSDQSRTVALEERTTEDSVASEIDPPVDIKQEQPLEEIKGVDTTEAEEDFHTSQADAIEKLASDNNIATIEPTYDIQQVDDLEATEVKQNAEAINDGEQSNIAVSEEPTPTDNGATPEDQHVDSNKRMMGNETDNVILAHGIKDEIQKSAELKDDPCDLGETIFTTQRSENLIDEDAVQTSVSDTVETSNNIHQVKEEPNAGTEHNSSQMASERNGENATHVQDRDVDVQILTESGTAEASQALFENDPQAAQDTTEKDDTTKGSEQTIDHDSRQHCDVALQQQSCETDALSILEQDEALQKIHSDQKQKEDEEIKSQNDELQVDEQKHEDNRDDLTTEPLVEYQNFENGATNKTKDNDAFEADQTEAAISVILKNEALHISKESTPSIMDMKVENIKETSEGTEEDDDAKNDNKDEQENAENDDVVAKTSTNEQAETTDEIRKEEIEPGLISSVQEASDPAPSKDKILENDPVHVIQASEKEIADETEECKEIHEDNAICHDELQTNSEKEESPQLRSNEPCNVDAIDDTTPLCEEIIHDNASIKPRETEEIGENKGLDSTSEPSVESTIQNNVEDSSSHHEVEDKKLSMSEKNDVDTEAMQEKNDESAADINQTEQCQEEINVDDVLQLDTEENSFDKIEETASHEETETSSTAATEAVTINDDITDKVSKADGAPSDESLKTFTDTGRDLDVSLVITTSKEESVNDNMENLNLDLPGHPAQDDNTPEKVLSLEETEREMPSSEKLLQTEPGENQIPNEQDEKDIQDENQTPKEKNEEDVQDTEFGEAKKVVEQELPVSHFLMNLILGKQSSDANEDSESEGARKQGEATEDGSCVFISKQEENLGSLPTENKVDDNLTFVEQEKHEVKCPEETQEIVKEQSDDLKLDTERSIKTDEDIKKNTHDLEIPAYQDNPQDEISGELLTGEVAGVSTKMETRDIDISSVELDDRAVGTVCQENMEASTKNENGSLRSSLNDSTNTKAPKEDTLGEGQTGLVLESLPEDKSVDAVSEQAPLLTESGMTDANDLSSDTASVQNPVSAKQDKPTESANVEATCSTDIQLENEEVDKKEEEQHANTATDEVSEENVESSHVNLQKITSSEVTSNELATQITEPVCDTQTILAREKEISEENFPTAVEIQADGPNLQINQDKQDEAADNESTMEPEKVGESNFQEHQEIGTEQKSPEETDEGDQQLLAKKEILTQEQDVHETVESPQQTVSIKSNEDGELFDPKVQERDLNVISPREASEAEENFVDVSKLWLMQSSKADAEQSPKADAEEKIYDEKIKDIEGTKNFTDEAAMKTEAPGAAQKALKKHGLLSGVGSKKQFVVMMQHILHFTQQR